MEIAMTSLRAADGIEEVAGAKETETSSGGT